MYRLLVIDDDPIIRKLLHKTFAPEGFEVLLTENISSGIAACEANRPDIVLLDVNLPDGNGIDCCRVLKSRPNVKHIPVIMMTGEAVDVDHRVDGLESGAEDYVTKPFLPKEVLARVKGILKSNIGPGQSRR